MIDQTLKDLWIPTGLLLGFQVTLFKWRIEREASIGDKGDIPWLTPADYVGICGMLVFVFLVIMLPSAGFIGIFAARTAFGVGTLLFVGQYMSLAGHYQLYNLSKHRKFIWFPMQEKIAIFLTMLAAIGYVVACIFYST